MSAWAWSLLVIAIASGLGLGFILGIWYSDAAWRRLLDHREAEDDRA